MADGLANALSLIANYSNYYSVLSVLICFILMVIFILRLNGDILLSSSAVHHRVVQEQSMLGLQNPFSVHLLKRKTSSLKDGVYIDMSVLDSTLVAAVWGINIPAFQQTLQLPSIEIWERFKSKSLFDGKYIEYQDCGQIDVSSSSREIYVACPLSITEASLGEPPRQVYPVVIITARENPDISLNYTAILCTMDYILSLLYQTRRENPILNKGLIWIHHMDVKWCGSCSAGFIRFPLGKQVVQFTVLHLKDSVCSLDSHIVYQFLKTNQNQLLSLQPIFVSTTEAADITQPTRQTSSPKTFPDNTAAGESTDKLMASVKQSSQREQSIKLESSADSHVESVSHQDEKHIVQENCSGRCEENVLDTDHEKLFVFNSTDLAQSSAVTADDCAKSEELKPSLRDTKCHTKLKDRDAEDRLTDTVEVCDVLEEATNLCVVCQNAPVFYTLLQCRHACVCFTCIKLLDKCPMCRGFIDSYFRLDAAPDPVISDSVEEVVGPRVPWWEALNNRLNHLLGFE